MTDAKNTEKPERPQLPELEMAERRWWYNQALANIMQEGFVPDEKHMELHEKTITGELTLDEAFPPWNYQAGIAVCRTSGKDTWYWCLQTKSGHVVEERWDYPDEATARAAAEKALAEYKAQHPDE